MDGEEPTMNKRRRREALIGFLAVLFVNLCLAFVPGWAFLMWLFEWVYILPLACILFFMKRKRIAAGTLLAGGATVILDVAYCGFAVSH